MRPYFELTQYYYTMTKKNTKVAMQVRGLRGSYRSNKLPFCASVKQFYSPRIGKKIPIGLRTGAAKGWLDPEDLVALSNITAPLS